MHREDSRTPTAAAADSAHLQLVREYLIRKSRKISRTTCSLTSQVAALLLASLVCVVSQVGAQVTALPEYRMEVYDEDAGLAQSQISAILPDSNGFLWVATQAGVQRFDGSRFYTPVSSGRLIGYPWRVSMLFHGTGNDILAFVRHDRIFTLSGGYIRSASAAEIARLGVLLGNTNLPMPDAGRFPFIIDQKPKLNVRAISIGWAFGKDSFAATTEQNELAFFTRQGLIRSVPIPVRTPTIERNRLLFCGSHALYFNNKAEALCYAADGHFVASFASPLRSMDKLPYCCQSPVDRQCGYLIQDSVLYRISVVGDRFKAELLLDQLPKGTLPAAVWEKDANTIVVATQSNGLLIFRRRMFRVTGADLEGPQSIFTSQLLMPDGETTLAGAMLFSKTGAYTGHLHVLDSIWHNCYLRDAKGKYWYSSDNFLFSADTPGRPVFRLHTGVAIMALYEDMQGKIWYMTRMNRLYYISHDSVVPVPLPATMAALSLVESIGEDRQGNILIGTHTGLYTINKAGSGYQASEKVLLPDADVRFIGTDSAGDTWLGTYGQGLLLYRNGQLIRFPMDAGGHLAFVHAVIPDTLGRLWMPTNNGLLMATRASMLRFAQGGEAPFYYRFDYKDGFRSNEFNFATPPYLWLPDGILSLPSMNGLVRFRPVNIRLATGHHRIIVDYIRADSQFLNTLSGAVIGSGLHSITIHVSMPDWTASTQQLFRYQLVNAGDEPLPQAWFDAPDNGLISFSSLSGGRYRLLLQSARFGNDSDSAATAVDFEIMQPWYRRTAAVLLWILLALGSALAGFLLWGRYLRRRVMLDKLLLEQQLKAMRAQLDPHFIQNTFSLLGNSISAGRQEEALDSLTQISSYFRRILYKIDRPVISLEEELDFARDYLAMTRLIYAGHFSFHIMVDPATDTFSVKVPTLVLQPFLENAVKYGISNAGDAATQRITLELKWAPPYTVCIISDPSQGIRPAEKPAGYVSKGRGLSVQRLEKLYGKSRHMPKLQTAKDAQGYTVSLFIPIG